MYTCCVVSVQVKKSQSKPGGPPVDKEKQQRVLARDPNLASVCGSCWERMQPYLPSKHRTPGVAHTNGACTVPAEVAPRPALLAAKFAVDTGSGSAEYQALHHGGSFVRCHTIQLEWLKSIRELLVQVAIPQGWAVELPPWNSIPVSHAVVSAD